MKPRSRFEEYGWAFAWLVMFLGFVTIIYLNHH